MYACKGKQTGREVCICTVLARSPKALSWMYRRLSAIGRLHAMQGRDALRWGTSPVVVLYFLHFLERGIVCCFLTLSANEALGESPKAF